MARKQGFLDADFSTQFDESYAALQHQQQTGADKVILALLISDTSPSCAQCSLDSEPGC